MHQRLRPFAPESQRWEAMGIAGRWPTGQRSLRPQRLTAAQADQSGAIIAPGQETVQPGLYYRRYRSVPVYPVTLGLGAPHIHSPPHLAAFRRSLLASKGMRQGHRRPLGRLAVLSTPGALMPTGSPDLVMRARQPDIPAASTPHLKQPASHRLARSTRRAGSPPADHERLDDLLRRMPPPPASPEPKLS